ncbi:hypothetical protein SAMN02983003_4066 [Devosia enhydra]|uniref:Membrane-bound lysozyme-inhibitor of c-type lysozyme n=1 Tax=Devosia enhydra TaxID=665118 RepID=A0A1K2I3R4_9HYPH|nr:hypothetical protein [Devosia enhydra]SFZ86871.1 hypothetical protein SAMN02983003_4066 [Devosia enhydra]
MTALRLVPFLLLAALPTAALAETVEANCTGMFDLDIYQIDLDLPRQEIEGLGEADVTVTDESIVAKGGFGEYRFDRKVGTLYVDGSDSGIYCTYSTPKG